MPYPEYLVAPMRQELTARWRARVPHAGRRRRRVKAPGVVMMVVNSVCGCAAGKARPGIAMALQHAESAGHRRDGVRRRRRRRDRSRARSTSPGSRRRRRRSRCLRDGKLVYMVERRDIESAIGAGHRRPADDGVRQVLRAASRRRALSRAEPDEPQATALPLREVLGRVSPWLLALRRDLELVYGPRSSATVANDRVIAL